MRTAGAIAIAAAVLIAAARPASAQTWDAWVEARIDSRLESRIVAENGKGADRQHESPAGDRSTSLVDQSSATDFVSLAFNLATVASPQLANVARTAGIPISQPAGAQTVTASLYALLAGLNGKNPTDPDFYKRHVDARRMSFTIGTAASDAATDNTDKAATVLGGKVLLINSRELYRARNLKTIKDVGDAFLKAATQLTTVKDQIQGMLFRRLHPEGVNADGTFKPVPFAMFLGQFSEADFPAFVTSLTPDDLALVDARVDTVVEPFNALNQTIRSAYDDIRDGQQLAILYTATVRPDSGYNDHRMALAFDYGLSPRITWTANGSFNYTDKKAAGSDSEGRFATAFVGDVTRGGEGWGRAPIRLALSGQVIWKRGQQVSRDVQATFTIPITAGVELPVVYRYGSSPLGADDGPQARVGLSIDVSRLKNALPD